MTQSNSSSHLDLKEYDQHRLVVYLRHPASKLEGFIAIHRGSKKLKAFGATRIYPYSNQIEALKDALRLAKIMSFKSAAANLPYGGAKAVIIARPEDVTPQMIAAYADDVNLLAGRFITGADIGMSQEQVKQLKKSSQHVVGGEIDPVKYTVAGIIKGMKVGLKHVFGDDEFHQRTFAIQGLGKIGSGVLNQLYPTAAKIYATDVLDNVAAKIKKMYPKIELVKPEAITMLPVDVFVPCAMYGIINEKTVKQLQCKLVAGGANNQLSAPNMGDLLYQRNILYTPDYIINAGGLISVVDEYEYPRRNHQRVMKKLDEIAAELDQIFSLSYKTKRSPHLIADEINQQKIESHEE